MSAIPVLRNYIIENFFFGEEENIADNAPLFENGLIDSTGILELVCFIEETFAVEVKDEELIPANFSTLQTIETFLKQKRNGNGT